MAGWFEAFAQFAGAGAQGLDRYQQLRQLDEQNQLKIKQQQFENQLATQNAQRQQQLADLQSRQLNAALLRDEQELMTSTLMPGQKLDQGTQSKLTELNLGHTFDPGGQQLPTQQIRPMQIGSQTHFLEGDAADPMQGMQPIADSQSFQLPGKTFQLPSQPFSDAQYRGTPDQIMKFEQTYGPQRRSNAIMQAVLGGDFSQLGPQELLALRMSGAPGTANLSMSDFATPRPPALSDWEGIVQTKQRELGRQLTAQEILGLRKEWGTADDRVQTGELTPTGKANVINRLTGQWNAANAAANDLKTAHSRMKVGMEAARRGDLAQGSQAVLVTFQKILDPTSVVRESEYARSAAGLAVLDRMAGSLERLAKGGAGVPLDELQKFERLADEMVTAQNLNTAARGVRERITRNAEYLGIPANQIFEFPMDAPPQTGGGLTIPPIVTNDRPAPAAIPSVVEGSRRIVDGVNHIYAKDPTSPTGFRWKPAK
jgi:hypothetical protein